MTRPKEDSVLHVAETLELDGDILDDSDGLSSIDENGDIEGGKLILHKDPACTSRYFVTHDFGVHAVVVPLVDTLTELAARGDRNSFFLIFILTFFFLFINFLRITQRM